MLIEGGRRGAEIRFKRRQSQCRFFPGDSATNRRFLLTQLLKQGLCAKTGFVAALSQSWALPLHNLPSICLL